MRSNTTLRKHFVRAVWGFLPIYDRKLWTVVQRWQDDVAAKSSWEALPRADRGLVDTEYCEPVAEPQSACGA